MEPPHNLNVYDVSIFSIKESFPLTVARRYINMAMEYSTIFKKCTAFPIVEKVDFPAIAMWSGLLEG